MKIEVFFTTKEIKPFDFHFQIPILNIEIKVENGGFPPEIFEASQKNKNTTLLSEVSESASACFKNLKETINEIAKSVEWLVLLD